MSSTFDADLMEAIVRLSPHERAVARGEILVRCLADSVIATSAIEGIQLDRQEVLAAVFHKLVEIGEI